MKSYRATSLESRDITHDLVTSVSTIVKGELSAFADSAITEAYHPHSGPTSPRRMSVAVQESVKAADRQ